MPYRFTPRLFRRRSASCSIGHSSAASAALYPCRRWCTVTLMPFAGPVVSDVLSLSGCWPGSSLNVYWREGRSGRGRQQRSGGLVAQKVQVPRKCSKGAMPGAQGAAARGQQVRQSLGLLSWPHARQPFQQCSCCAGRSPQASPAGTASPGSARPPASQTCGRGAEKPERMGRRWAQQTEEEEGGNAQQGRCSHAGNGTTCVPATVCMCEQCYSLPVADALARAVTKGHEGARRDLQRAGGWKVQMLEHAWGAGRQQAERQWPVVHPRSPNAWAVLLHSQGKPTNFSQVRQAPLPDPSTPRRPRVSPPQIALGCTPPGWTSTWGCGAWRRWRPARRKSREGRASVVCKVSGR